MSEVLGWDIGGAHLKAARCRGGEIVAARQVPCALWQGLDRLVAALGEALRDWPPGAAHAVTMTGELADLFADRATGVRQILATIGRHLAGRIAVYAGDDGFLSVEQACATPQRVASANWHAPARLAAQTLKDGLLVDIGSTTTDLVPFRSGRLAARGATDSARLAAGELVYQGVVRTPVMAVARRVWFGEARAGVMAELFATMADVYRVTGELPADADLHPTADGRGKSVAESRVRLARMIGCDRADAPDEAWDALARQLARRHLALLEAASEQVLAATPLPSDAPLVGAGAGRFLAARLARRLDRPYRDFAALIAAPAGISAMAATCAPAAAVALLMPGADPAAPGRVPGAP